MDKFKIVIKCLLFFTVGTIIFQALTILFVPKWVSKIDPATPRWAEFYEQEQGTIDVLLIGASDVGRGLSPITLWEDYGITSFNLGTSNQSMAFSYYVIKEAIKYQDVKTIVLDMDCAFMKGNAPEGEYRKLFDNVKLGKTKIEAIQDSELEITDQLSYIFPLLRFHDRWDKLEQKDFETNQKYKAKYSYSYKGMAISNAVKPYTDDQKYMEEKGKVEEIPEWNLKYIDKIIKLCEEKNIELLMIEIPSASSWSKARGEAVEKLAKQYNKKFIDMNVMLEELLFDWTTDTADGGNHLNVAGAEKISKYLGNILKQEYRCQDHRDDSRYSSWNDEANRYEQTKNDEVKQKNEKQSKIQRESK